MNKIYFKYYSVLNMKNRLILKPKNFALSNTVFSFIDMPYRNLINYKNLIQYCIKDLEAWVRYSLSYITKMNKKTRSNIDWDFRSVSLSFLLVLLVEHDHSSQEFHLVYVPEALFSTTYLSEVL